MSATQLAPVTWAQRKDSLYLTINVADVQDAKIELTEDKLVFHGTSNKKEYAAELEFFAPVDPSDAVRLPKCEGRWLPHLPGADVAMSRSWQRGAPGRLHWEAGRAGEVSSVSW
jgi:hypothetical protein